MTIENGSGWQDKGEGVFEGPPMVNASTPEFSEFAEKNRSRWDLFEYIKTILSIQKRHNVDNENSSIPK